MCVLYSPKLSIVEKQVALVQTPCCSLRNCGVLDELPTQSSLLKIRVSYQHYSLGFLEWFCLVPTVRESVEPIEAEVIRKQGDNPRYWTVRR